MLSSCGNWASPIGQPRLRDEYPRAPQGARLDRQGDFRNSAGSAGSMVVRGLRSRDDPPVRVAVPSLCRWRLYRGQARGKTRGTSSGDALRQHGDWSLKIIKRSDTATDFERLPRRWVVEPPPLAGKVPASRQKPGAIDQKLHTWAIIVSSPILPCRIARLSNAKQVFGVRFLKIYW